MGYLLDRDPLCGQQGRCFVVHNEEPRELFKADNVQIDYTPETDALDCVLEPDRSYFRHCIHDRNLSFSCTIELPKTRRQKKILHKLQKHRKAGCVYNVGLCEKDGIFINVFSAKPKFIGAHRYSLEQANRAKKPVRLEGTLNTGDRVIFKSDKEDGVVILNK